MESPKENILHRLVKRPSSLLTKIFLWFFIYIVTVFVVGFYISTTTVNFSTTSRVLKEASRDALLLYGQTLVERYEQGGEDYAARSVKRLEESDEMLIYFFDGRGKQIFGNSGHGFTKEQIAAILDGKKDKRASTYRADDCRYSTMRRLTGESGDHYVIFAEPTHDSLGDLMTGFLISRLSIWMIIAVCFSYLLSRYLTNPIRILRAATRKLAMGDLSTRIGLQKGKRRDELVGLAADFDQMAEKIEILEDERRQFLSGISHELRSPLTRLNMAVEMARKRNHLDISDYLERVDLESERLKSIMDRMFAITRNKNLVEAGNPVSIDLNGLLDTILRDATFEAKCRNCAIKRLSGPAIVLTGTRHLLKSALENVIENAIHYTREGTCVEISMDIEDRSNGSFCLIRIRDHGKGVAEDSLRKIFEPFFRVDDSRDRRSGGTGLGLAITERAIRYHHGTVKAFNAPGGGLIIEISLPISRLKPEPNI